MSKRRTHSPEFKAKVAMEVIANELFIPGKKNKAKDGSQAKESDLFKQIGRLQMELEWPNEISAAVTPTTYRNSLTMRIPILHLAANVSS
jgi:hypothetical protein